LGFFTLTNITNTLPPGSPNTLQLSFDPTLLPGSLLAVNNDKFKVGVIPASYTPGSLLAANSSPITFTATPNGPGDYNISGADNITKTFGSESTGVASLNLSFKSLSVNDGGGVFVGSVNSVGANALPGYDFSTFAQGGFHNLTLSGTSELSEVLSTPGASVTGGIATFSEAVPEPTSVAAWGVGLIGLLVVRRFIQRPSVA
jgi:hypothetical protein